MSELPDFSKLRHNEAHHLGLGDVRITIAQQNAIDQRIAELEKTRQAHVDEIVEYKADNERLGARNGATQAKYEEAANTCADYEQEIERLREALVTVEMVADCTKDTWEGVCAHCTAKAALEGE